MKTNNGDFNIANVNKAIEELNLENNFDETIIYKYVNFNTLKLILEGNTLFFNTASKFNDPFDLYVGLIDFNYSKNDFKLLVDNHKTASLLKRKERRELIFKANRRRDKKLIVPEFKEQFEKIRKTHGISCFSKIPDSTLMWSHYADNHKGACLGFKFNSSEDFYTLSVKYAPEIVPLNYFFFKEKAILNCFFTKSKIWEYEQEVRAVNFRNNGPISFEKSSLQEIYFGLRTSEDDLKEANSLLYDNGYPVCMKKKMIINPKTFDLEAVDLKLH